MQLPSAFEAAVLGWIAKYSEDQALREQLAQVAIRERRYTVVGCYAELDVPPIAPTSTGLHADGGVVLGPSFEAGVVDHGGGTLLWLEHGRATCLEIFAFGDYFPEDHAELAGFRLG